MSQKSKAKNYSVIYLLLEIMYPKIYRRQKMNIRKNATVNVVEKIKISRQTCQSKNM